MNLFQIVGLSLVGVFFVGSLLRLVGRRAQRLATVGWLAVWAASAGALLKPELTKVVARAVGIDRGADLVSYLTTLLLLAFIFVISIRLRRFEMHVTQLTRELALTRAQLPPAPGIIDAQLGE